MYYRLNRNDEYDEEEEDVADYLEGADWFDSDQTNPYDVVTTETIGGGTHDGAEYEEGFEHDYDLDQMTEE